MGKVKVETEDEKKAREMVEGIAINIEKLSGVINAILNGRLQKKTLVILLAHSTDLPQNKVELVLDALKDLAKNTLKP